MLQSAAMCRSALQHDIVCCSVLQCVVVCCSVLQCVVVCWVVGRKGRDVRSRFSCVAVCVANVLHCVLHHMLQCDALCCVVK